MWNHRRQQSLQIWDWKGGCNLPRRPMVRYKKDSGAAITSAQKPKWRFTQLQSSLLSSTPLFTVDKHSDETQASPPTIHLQNQVERLLRLMANSRLPKAVFYSELHVHVRQGKRSHGGQRLSLKRCLEVAYEENRHLAWYLGGRGSPESQMARTLGSYFKQFPMQSLSMLLQIQSGSDCQYESLFKIGFNSSTGHFIFGNKGQPLLLLLLVCWK